MFTRKVAVLELTVASLSILHEAVGHTFVALEFGRRIIIAMDPMRGPRWTFPMEDQH